MRTATPRLRVETIDAKEGSMSLTTEYLQDKGVPIEVIPHEKAFTSIAEARTLGIEADAVVKTLLLDTVAGHALAVIPGDRRLDMKLVEEVVGDKHAHLATEQEILRDVPGIELGSLPPLGGLLRAHAYVDPDVMKHETVVFAAGAQTESIKARTEDLFRSEQVTVARLTRQVEEAYA
jgi:prolyl-tRNA editing enzyme YbaK/EbsC (Cys-tRNA(Pro) deacylase)